MVSHHPFGQNRPAAADDAGDAARGQRDVLHQDAGMDGHVVDALRGLLLDHFEHDGRAQVLDAPDARQGFVDRDRPHGHRRSVDDRLADFRDIAAGGKVHHGVGAVFDRVLEFFEFAGDVRSRRRIADVGVDLASRSHANGHRLQAQVVDIGWDNHPATGHFVAHQRGRQAFAPGDIGHLFGDRALSGIVHLRADFVGFSRFHPVGSLHCSDYGTKSIEGPKAGYSGSGAPPSQRPRARRLATSARASSWSFRVSTLSARLSGMAPGSSRT